MGNCLSIQQDKAHAQSSAKTSDLYNPLLEGNSGRSDVKPDQSVRSPETQAELDFRKAERDKEMEFKKEQRRIDSLNRKLNEEI